MSEIMTAADVAEYLKIDKQTVYRKARAGEIPSFRIGRAVRFERPGIEDWVRAQTRTEDERKAEFEKVLAEALVRAQTWTEEDTKELYAWAEAWAKERGITEEDVQRMCDEVRHGPSRGG